MAAAQADYSHEMHLSQEKAVAQIATFAPDSREALGDT